MTHRFHACTDINSIIVIGGGTAGWLTANHLAKVLKPTPESGPTITLIEAPNIASIGVGEGTVPALRKTLQYLGIRETDIIQQCDASFKQSIQFVDWQPMVNGKAHSYHHAFDYPEITRFNAVPYWLSSNTSSTSFTDCFTVQGKVCDQQKAPKRITDPEYQGVCNYAYHFDALKFAALLAQHATNKLGVQRVFAEIEQVVNEEDDCIRYLVSKDGQKIEADFFVDCSGSRALLIGQHLNTKFIDKSDILFVDKALAVQLPHSNAESEIGSSTIASARSAGWIWDIPLQSRRGVGYVYSSSHANTEQVEKELRQYLQLEQTPEYRTIAMQVGYREKFWRKNCVAIGLSQGFVEPLEATGLLLFDISARMLAEQFPVNKADISGVSTRFNQNCRVLWDKVINFIKLHYCVSQRQDSAFWCDNREQSSIPESLRQDLEHWKYHVPSWYDFNQSANLFNLENYLYVLYGMNFKTDITHSQSRYQQSHKANEVFSQVEQAQIQAQSILPSHRKLIQQIMQHGLQTI